jgi:hypothetical protein
MGGRTCVEAPSSGCLGCTTSSGGTMSEGCAGTACVFTAAQVGSVQYSDNCQPADTPDFSTWHCQGRWAVLDQSNTFCTIQTVPTGAIRWTVSCGACVAYVNIRN